jgi:glycine cleavage system regulatory protein
MPTKGHTDRIFLLFQFIVFHASQKVNLSNSQAAKSINTLLYFKQREMLHFKITLSSPARILSKALNSLTLMQIPLHAELWPDVFSGVFEDIPHVKVV